MKNKIWQILFIFLVTISGCKTPKLLSWQHTPLHPDNGNTVNFKVTGSDNEGIKKVNLYVYEYEMYEGPNGYRSARPRSGGQWGLVHTWDLSPTQKNIALDFDYTTGFPASSMVRYEFELINTSDNKIKKLAWMDAGTCPWPEILLYSTSEQAPVNTVDVMLVPDQDYSSNWRQFLTDMETTVYNGYMQNNMTGWRNGHHNQWSFYYVRAEGTASSRTVPSSISSSSLIDVFAILHNSVFRDARSGNKFSSEFFNIGTCVHETGHAAFNLADEYCCDTHYFEPGTDGNLYNTLSECQNANTSIGSPASDCESFVADAGGTWFRPEPAALGCIMQDDGDARLPEFERNCQKWIRNFYTGLDGR